MDISGAVAVVTGGTGAIGQAIISRLAGLGAKPVAWDVWVGDGDDQTISCDVGSAASVEEAMDRTVAAHGVPSILVTVAAVSGGFSPLASSANEDEWSRVLTDPDTWQRVLSTNVIGVANCMRAFSHRLATAKRTGAIVNISSISSSLVAEPGLISYSASKAALRDAAAPPPLAGSGRLTSVV